MELTEKERLMLVSKMEEIRKLTLRNLDIVNDPQNEIEIKKNFTSIINLMSQIASYSPNGNYPNKLTLAINELFRIMTFEKKMKYWSNSPSYVELTCNYVNSAKFNFTKNGIKIILPKINLNFGPITNM